MNPAPPLPVDPLTGIGNALANFDHLTTQAKEAAPADLQTARMIAAQAHATVALVHAVRELTTELRAARQTGAQT